MQCSHFFSKESFSFAIKSLEGHTAILYHSRLVEMNRNFLSRPTCFELPSPAELFFLWICNAPTGLEASSKRQTQAARGPGSREHAPPACTAQGWPAGIFTHRVFTPGTGSVRTGRKILKLRLACVNYCFGRMASNRHTHRRAAFS